MRLIRLSSDRPSFKTVNFKPHGVTLIIGKHQGVDKIDLKKTYNGVGKSLVVALVNYCLGSNKNEQFDRHLKGWTFRLEFEHEGIEHFVMRTPGESKLVFDGQVTSLTQYKESLLELGIFSIPTEDEGFLSFRSLLSFFLRPRRGSYTDFSKPRAEWSDFQSVLCQSFLLGLDYKLALRKYEDKKNLDEQISLAERYKKDKDLREFYVGEKNAEVELLELNTQIKSLESDLASFRVAKNYAERQAKADRLHNDMLELQNESVVENNLLEDIDSALARKPDVSPELVQRVYEQVTVELPILARKRMHDVEEFYRRLQKNRAARLSDERAQVLRRITSLERRQFEIKKQLDAELQFLNAHRALDEYSENAAHLESLRERASRIRDYVRLIERYTERAQTIRAEMAAETVRTNHYLRNAQNHLEYLMSEFRKYSKELYGSVPAGLIIKNNDGENQCRYEISAHIQNDAADGIDQGKLFCYDFLLLTSGQRHKMEFLFHDNRLFADMDKNQRYSLFRLACNVCHERRLQYIATINEDVADSIKEVAADDYEDLVSANVVLELTDEPGGAGKLLGVQVDMNYEDS